jgi:hypothetical protein
VLSIEITASDTPESAAAKFSEMPEGIIFLLGSFDATIAPQVRSVLGRALIPIAVSNRAAIVDNGSTDGIAGLLGLAAQQAESTPVLLGIMKAGDAGPEPNHSHVMRLPAEWTDAAKMTFFIAVELARSKTGREKPVMVVLAGGGEEEKSIALRCMRHGWPLVLMQGAGGIADELVAATAPATADGTTPAPPQDPELREIAEGATIFSFPLTATTDQIKQVLVGPIQGPGDILADAWDRFDVLDEAAKTKQALFRLTQICILSLTVLVTLLAIVALLCKRLPAETVLPVIGKFNPFYLQNTLHIVMIIVPITISMLIGFNARFREGNKWILLRAAAEAIKREIFRYRTRSGVYSETACVRTSASTRLAATIKEITGNLVHSEVNRTSLPRVQQVPAGAEAESIEASLRAARIERLKFLDAEGYIHERIENQIDYLVAKTGRLSSQLKSLQVYIVTAGGLGTFLAAMGGEIWVALTTAVAAALTNKLEIEQVENSLVQYNTTLTNLRNVNSWWSGMSPWEKTRQKNFDLLVDQTEKSLEQETTGWVQQMQSTLDKLSEKESSEEQKRDGRKSNA